MWPYPLSRSIWIGSMTTLLLPLDTTVTWPPLPLQEITASLPVTRRIRRPKTPLARSHGSYGHVGERRGSLGQPPIRILHPGRLEVGLSVRRQPIEIRHSKRLAQWPGLDQRPIIIRHSRKLAQRPGRGQRPMIIHHSLWIGLESAGQWGVLPVEDPLTFLRPQHSQSPRIWTNHNSELRSDPDHSEFRGVYKPVQPSFQQDYTNRSRRDSFSGSGLSSPALQRTHSLDRPLGSGNKSLTDPKREERIAGGLRPSLVLTHPHTACPDTRLDLDAAPPEAAAISCAEWPPTAVDIPETGRLETTRRPEPSHRRGLRSPRRLSRKRPRNRSPALYRPKKRPPHPSHWCE